MGYPIVQAIESILPLVNEFIVALGPCEDTTEELIHSIPDESKKIRVIHTKWENSEARSGLILSEKTNEALTHCSHDWCFYIQADEVIHEADYSAIRESLRVAQNQKEVEGLLFDYIHFYGSYHVIACSRKWYRREVRIVRKSSAIQSVADAQGFRVHGKKPLVVASAARVFHYGWVKPPKQMGLKSKLLNRLWHGNKLDEKFDNFEYSQGYGLQSFKGEHPKVMKELVAAQSWEFEIKNHILSWGPSDWNNFASDIFEKIFRYRIGEYKPYKVVKLRKQ